MVEHPNACERIGNRYVPESFGLSCSPKAIIAIDGSPPLFKRHQTKRPSSVLIGHTQWLRPIKLAKLVHGIPKSGGLNIA
jgi:hypothetical protein